MYIPTYTRIIEYNISLTHIIVHKVQYVALARFNAVPSGEICNAMVQGLLRLI